ncbi:MAG: hypothetical protein HND52_04770 [Ignavibacteriae bacterium]|nr:hypothetical protein [Ignavibacteriota bacterium]NOG97272.1 hypothetical protein [Ignavibacteriota bacterium]
MNTKEYFLDYCQKLDNLVVLDEDEQNEMFDGFIEFAKSNKEDLVPLIKDISPERGELLNCIYDNLMSQIDIWQKFFVDELKRLFSFAEYSENYREVFVALDAFSYITVDEDKSFFEEIREELLSRTYSSNISIKRKAVWMMGDFLFENNVAYVKRLDELIYDLDWKTRCLAHLALNELYGKNEYANMDLMDKIKYKFKNVFDF